MAPPTVFVSYSHQDKTWKDLVLPHLNVLAQLALIDVWTDERIDSGAAWFPKIQSAMEKAVAAICLISANYLSSDFVLKEEVPYFLAQREKRGLLILPVLVSECPWRLVEWIRATQLIPRGARPLDSLADPEKNKVLSGLAELIAKRLGNSPGRGKRPVREVVRPPAVDLHERTYFAGELPASTRDDPLSPTPDFIDPSRSDAQTRSQRCAVDIARLPVTGAELFGRTEELRWLDRMWNSPTVRVVSLVAWGGVGKSTLVNKWLERLAAEGYRGARRIFGWSFFSQGTSERVTSANLFIDQALCFFSDPDPTAGSPWAKGERLAALVRAERSLLVLDGLEPLQNPADGWRVQDSGLEQLLRRLARPPRAGSRAPEHPGLCVITSREHVADLDGFAETVESRDLNQITPEAGRALLRVRGVQGTDGELETVAQAFGSQALAVNLLASYLQGVAGHPASAATKIPELDIPEERGRHPRRVFEAFAQRFGSGPEIELLLLLGLFDRPASTSALAALRAAPAIQGLTDHLVGLSEGEWERLLRKMRRERLVAEEDRHQPEEVDAHPLVREHFGERLGKKALDAQKEGHWRLSEFYRQSAAPKPTTPAALAPLFAAIYHACKAGREDKGYDLYRRQVHREDEFFALTNLGVTSELLQALSGFFDSKWTRPTAHLAISQQRYLLSQAGVLLTALGPTREALDAHVAALALSIEMQDAAGAAIESKNASFLHAAIGDLDYSIAEARRSIDFANRAADKRALCLALAVLATSLHQKGQFAESEAQFLSAECVEREIDPDAAFLYSSRGFRFCDLLLDRGEWREVKQRAESALVIALKHQRLRDIGLDHLSLGKAHLVAARELGPRELTRSGEQLEKAFDVLLRAGWESHLNRALLARAELRLQQADLGAALEDLADSLELCTV